MVARNLVLISLFSLVSIGCSSNSVVELINNGSAPYIHCTHNSIDDLRAKSPWFRFRLGVKNNSSSDSLMITNIVFLDDDGTDNPQALTTEFDWLEPTTPSVVEIGDDDNPIRAIQVGPNQTFNPENPAYVHSLNEVDDGDIVKFKVRITGWIGSQSLQKKNLSFESTFYTLAAEGCN